MLQCADAPKPAKQAKRDEATKPKAEKKVKSEMSDEKPKPAADDGEKSKSTPVKRKKKTEAEAQHVRRQRTELCVLIKLGPIGDRRRFPGRSTDEREENQGRPAYQPPSMPHSWPLC